MRLAALLFTIKALGFGLGIYFVIHEIFVYFTMEQISTGITIFSMLFLLYLIYDLKLSQLKHQEVLDKLEADRQADKKFQL